MKDVKVLDTKENQRENYLDKKNIQVWINSIEVFVFLQMVKGLDKIWIENRNNINIKRLNVDERCKERFFENEN